MSKAVKQYLFHQYIAAVEMARIESKGSGEPNKYDKVAAGMHEEGFDEALELMSDEEKANAVERYKADINMLSTAY